MALGGKMQRYAEGRASGMDPQTAGAHAGYAPGAGLAVAVSRIEARQDVKKEIKRLIKEGVEIDTESAPESEEKRKWEMKPRYDSPLDLLEDVMNNPNAPKSLRYQSAKDSLPYRHARVAEPGKKEKKEEAARAATKRGKFQGKSAPQRHVVN